MPVLIVARVGRRRRACSTRFDGLVLTGGPDVDPALYGQDPHPKTYGVDATSTSSSSRSPTPRSRDAVPMLAICRGIQVLNVALGGTLHQHIPELPGVAAHGRPGEPNGGAEQAVTLEPRSQLAKAMGATTRHAARATTISRSTGWATGLRVVGPRRRRHRRGHRARRARWLLAVQWHPEDTAGDDPAQQRLFDALVTESRTRH